MRTERFSTTETQRTQRAQRKAILLCLCFLCSLYLCGEMAAQNGPVSWPNYGNDGGGSRYSTLAQINRSNVAKLKVEWTYNTHALEPETPLNKKAAFEATPIMVDGILYFATPFSQVIALNAETGEEFWTFDPKVDRNGRYSEVTSRGVATWFDPKPRDGPCQRRIFVGTIDARLIALDAADGKPCPDFGEKGSLDLTKGISLKDAGNYQVTSPPAIIKELVIVGSSIVDNHSYDSER